ncbi:hypothetical protein F5B20DRAFT_70496 [Whalleya microplaca]|nr:hypothetical protein F5B20DRAFT_70496 [Whalleya microplaca]
MPGASLSKAASRAKARGLVIKTDFAQDSVAYPSKDGENFAQIATAPPRKQEFEVTEKLSAPKQSEALTNSDWRNNRRHRDEFAGIPVCLATAPPDKLEFSLEECKKPKKKLRIDTSAANAYGVRRYRTTPIDPDFIHSAPATKQEFGYVEDDDEDEPSQGYYEYDGVDDIEITQTSSALKEKPLVRLNAFTPTTRDGFEKILGWGPESDGSLTSGLSPLTQVTTVGSGEKGYENIHFPVATIRAVKNAKRLRIKGWDDIDDDVKKTLALLDVPHTASLPPDKLRIEYEQGKDALARKGVLDDPAIESLQLEGRHRHADFSSKADFRKEAEADQARFDALLDKLHKSAAPRLRAQSVIDIKPPHWTKDSEHQRKDDSEGSSLKTGVSSGGQDMTRNKSHDSGISGVYEDKPKKRAVTMLNPQAAEFNGGLPNRSASNPVHFGALYDDDSCPPEVQSDSKLDLQALFAHMNKRMNDLEAELAKSRAAGPQHEPVRSAEHNLMQSIANQLSLNDDRYGSVQQAPVMPFAGIFPRPDDVPRPNLPSSLPQRPYSFMPHFQPVQHQMNGGTPSVAPQNYPQTTNQAMPMVPPASFNFMPGLQFQPMPPPGVQMGPQAPPVTNPQMESRPAGPAPASFSHPYGPKPVRKPKAPFRTGDINQVQRQQEYEAYLEYKRATDPNYAQQCKQRQARRAERRKSERNSSERNSSEDAPMAAAAPVQA